MKKNPISVLIILILTVTVIMLLLYQKSERERLDIIKERLTFNLIQLQLIEVKNTIDEQAMNNWMNHEEINEQFQDLVKGIATTVSVSNLAKGLNKEDEELLVTLFEYFSKYVDRNEEVMYSENELKEIKVIGEFIKAAGFSENETISENWNETLIKLKKLNASIK